MVARLRVVYNEVLNAANRLDSEAQEIHALHNMLANETENLRQSGLRGQTSDAWYHDMTDTLLPKTQQLGNILGRASSTLKRLNAAFQSAEQDAGRLFKTRG